MSGDDNWFLGQSAVNCARPSVDPDISLVPISDALRVALLLKIEHGMHRFGFLEGPAREKLAPCKQDNEQLCA